MYITHAMVIVNEEEEKMKTYADYNVYDAINESIMMDEIVTIINAKARAILRAQLRYIRSKTPKEKRAEVNREFGLRSLHVISEIENGNLGSDRYADELTEMFKVTYPGWYNDPDFPDINLDDEYRRLQYELIGRVVYPTNGDVAVGMHEPIV